MEKEIKITHEVLDEKLSGQITDFLDDTIKSLNKNMELLQIPATISKAGTGIGKRSLRLQIDTQENLSEEQMQKILAQYDHLGYFCFLKGEQKIDPEDIKDLPAIKVDSSKTPSQRLRNVMWVLWKQEGEKGEFDLFYIETMNKFIQHIKDKLEPREEYDQSGDS